MKAKYSKLLSLVLGSLLATSTVAAEIVGAAPFGAYSYGQQSDANTGPAYEQTFSAPSGMIVDVIKWWGFHGPNSLGSASDNFVVTLDGVVQSGTLTVTGVSDFYSEYSLDISDAALTASSLGILNDSFDVEWFWQSTAATGNPQSPDGSGVAFSLIGYADEGGGGQLPEPSTLALFGLATIGLIARRRLTR